MVYMWRVKDRWSVEFAKVAVERATSASVFIAGSRYAKSSDGVQYFDDFDSAKEYAMRRLKDKVERSRKAMETAEEQLRQVEGVTSETVKTTTAPW